MRLAGPLCQAGPDRGHQRRVAGGPGPQRAQPLHQALQVAALGVSLRALDVGLDAGQIEGRSARLVCFRLSTSVRRRHADKREALAQRVTCAPPLRDLLKRGRLDGVGPLLALRFQLGVEDLRGSRDRGHMNP